jgi:hypothetical protein
MVAAIAIAVPAGPAAALTAPADFDFTLLPLAAPGEYALSLSLRASFDDVLFLSALVEPSWVPAAGAVVQSVTGSPELADAILDDTLPDNPAYELAYFDDDGNLVLGGITATAADPLVPFTWSLHIVGQPPGSTIRATVFVDQLDLDTFETRQSSGTQLLAAPLADPAPVPEPASWATLAVGLTVLGAGALRRGRRRVPRD